MKQRTHIIEPDLPPCFDEATHDNKKEFSFTLPFAGEFNCSFYHFGKKAFNFTLKGAVGQSGYRSTFVFREDLQGFQSPQEFAEKLALELYETEGKKHQKSLRVTILQHSQLRLF